MENYSTELCDVELIHAVWAKEEIKARWCEFKSRVVWTQKLQTTV